jgi:hypothetical protein
MYRHGNNDIKDGNVATGGNADPNVMLEQADTSA